MPEQIWVPVFTLQNHPGTKVLVPAAGSYASPEEAHRVAMKGPGTVSLPYLGFCMPVWEELHCPHSHSVVHPAERPEASIRVIVISGPMVEMFPCPGKTAELFFAEPEFDVLPLTLDELPGLDPRYQGN